MSPTWAYGIATSRELQLCSVSGHQTQPSPPWPAPRGQLADLEEVAVRVTEEGPDLPAPVDGFGEEGGTRGPEQLVGSPTVVDPEDDLRTDAVRIGQRHEDDTVGLSAVGSPPVTSRGFPGSRRTPSTTEVPPYSPYMEASKTRVYRVPARSGVRHDQEVGQRRGSGTGP